MRAAVRAASQLPGRAPTVELHVNKKSDDYDDDETGFDISC